MWYRSFLVGLMVVASVSLSCSKDDVVKQAAGDPVPTGMGTLATTAATAGVAAVATFVSQAAEASPAQKPAPGGIAGGFFPEQSSLACADGGSVNFSNQSATGFTATFSSCTDGPYTANLTAVITNMTTLTCTGDNADHEVPAGLTANVNGKITVDGQDMTLTNFGTVITNPQYSTGTGGTCALVAANIHATGQISTEIAGQTTTVDLGTSSLDVNFQGQESGVQASINGTLTVDTVCTDGPFFISITTISNLFIPDGNATPTSGQIEVSHDEGNVEIVDFANNPAPPIPCSGFLS